MSGHYSEDPDQTSQDLHCSPFCLQPEPLDTLLYNKKHVQVLVFYNNVFGIQIFRTFMAYKSFSQMAFLFADPLPH